MYMLSRTCALLAALALTASAAEDTQKSLRGGRGLADPGDAQLEEAIIQPLNTLAVRVRQQVVELLPRISETFEEDDDQQKKSMLAISASIRKLVSDTVPKLLTIRDASSAVDMDTRTSNASQATLVQKNLLKMQEYWDFAWPITIEQAQTAFGDEGRKAAIVDGVKKGISGALEYLKPVLAYNWEAEKLMMPNVQKLVHDNSSASALMEKAMCAADYARGLGDMTAAFVDLTKARRSCNGAGATTAQVQQCAVDDVAALQNVAGTIAEASKGMWECFGISWACAQLMNSALDQFVRALATSLEMSGDCSRDGVEACRPSDVFTALGALMTSVGAMEGVNGSCALKGSPPSDVLNPMAATPAELKAPRPRPAELLSLLAVADDALSAEVSQQMEDIASALDASMRKTISTAAQAIKSRETAGLAEAVDDVLQVLGEKLPAFFTLIKETNALDSDPALDTIYGGKPASAQKDLLVMLEFVVNHGPTSVRRVTGAAQGLSADTEFLEVVNEKLQEAKTFLGQALIDAWDGAALQIPRVEGLASEVSTEGVTEEERLQWGECASSYASALGQLTSLYSNLESSGADCNTTNRDVYDVQSCEADLVSDMSAIALSINAASKMMVNCFESAWQCTAAVSTASAAMLDAVGSIITMKANCGDETEGSRNVCESSVTKLLGDLGSATSAVRGSVHSCKARHPQPAALVSSEITLGSFAAAGAGCLATNGPCWVGAQCCTARCHSAHYRCRPIR